LRVFTIAEFFKNRFRIPFQLYLILVNICREHNIFEVKNYLRTKIPVEIKSLCCLRVLGREHCFDAIEEYSNVPEKTVWWFFKIFLRNFVSCLKDQVVRPPAEGIELSRVMQVYTKMGFPGAIGSVDATHIRWHMCPVDKVHLATGKEKYPSVAFQVIHLFLFFSSYTRCNTFVHFHSITSTVRLPIIGFKHRSHDMS
jgi:hypothetical protein